MAWISFVIVVLLFYEPFLGWGSQWVEEPSSAIVSLPWFDASFTIPYMEYVRLFIYSLLLWAFLFGILLAIETFLKRRAELLDSEKHFDLLRPINHPALDFRNGMLYARWPQTLIRLAEFLAKGVLGYQSGNWAIDGILALLSTQIPNLPGFVLDLFDLISYLLFDIDLQIIVLALFTWLVVGFYGREQSIRHDYDVREHDQERKKQVIETGKIFARVRR